MDRTAITNAVIEIKNNSHDMKTIDRCNELLKALLSTDATDKDIKDAEAFAKSEQSDSKNSDVEKAAAEIVVPNDDKAPATPDAPAAAPVKVVEDATSK